jgi:peptidyl-prolyl cis-trans isomerase D
MLRFGLAFAGLALVSACGPGSPGGPSMNNRMTATQTTASQTVESREILDREPRSNRTKVKHILVSWKEKASGAMGARADERALARTKLDAEREVRSLEKQLAAGADFDTLMKTHSEDKGSAAEAEAYEVTPDAQLVIEFRQLGLRLDVGEVGVVESDFGFHIIKRVE